MANITISDLALAILPLDGPNSFFEVQTIEGGVAVSRKVASDNIVIDVQSPNLTGTSADAIDLLDSLVAGRFGALDPDTAPHVEIDPAAIQAKSNFSTAALLTLQPVGGELALGSVGLTIAAAAGGLTVNNTLTGAGFERVLTASDIVAAGGQVNTVVSGANITINAADPINPIVDLDAAITGVSVNGVTLNDGGVATAFLNETGAYSVPAGGGATVNAGTVEDSILHWNNVSSEWDEMPEVTMNWVAGVLTMNVLDDGAVLRNVLVADADAGVDLFFDAVKVFETQSTGIAVNGSVLDLTAGADSFMALRARNTIGGVHLAVANATGQIRLQQLSSIGIVEDDVLIADRNGAVSLHHNGDKMLFTNGSGISVKDVTTGDDQPGILFVNDAEANMVAFRVQATGTVMDSFLIAIQQNSAPLNITGQDSSSVTHALIDADPDGEVALYFDGTLMARTASIGTNGSFQVTDDGTQFNPLRAPRVVKKNGSTSRNTTTTMTADPDLTISLPAGNWKVEVWLIVQAGVGSGDIKVGLDWSGAVNDVRGQLWSGPDLAAGLSGTGLVQYDTLDSTPIGLAFGAIQNLSSSHLIHCVCLFDANGSGTLAVHWAQNVSDAADTIVQAQSRMECTLIEP